jgi:hypothetical protein
VVVAGWCVVAVLATIGVMVSIFRGLTVFGVLESLQAEQLVQRLAMRAGLGLRVAELAAMDESFTRHPVITAAHIIPGLVFFVLAPLQFWSTFRGRNLGFHRWSGRLLVLLGLVLGASGLYFGLRAPFGGDIEAWGVALFGALFVGSLARAFIAVRRADLAAHRRWMIRAFGIALGISVMRIALDVLLAITGGGVQPVFGIAVWIGFVVTASGAELWIRYGSTAPDLHPRGVRARRGTEVVILTRP